MTLRCFSKIRARERGAALAAGLLTATVLTGPALAQSTPGSNSLRPITARDPGPRPVGNQGAAIKGAIPLNQGVFDAIQPKDADGNGAGRQLAQLTSDQTAFWFAALAVFGQQASVDGAQDPSTGNQTLRGLGPGFNGDSCVSCHAFPAVGGSSPFINPQVVTAVAKGAQNELPPFITANGPVREVRFVRETGDGLPRGAVRPLFSIQGRSDAPVGCTLAQPDFRTQQLLRNLAFRIPTPTFGLGYIENTPDETLRSNLQNTALQRLRLGINGHFNMSGNDQTIARFGWKAQNKSLLLFSGEAANVEMGVTNELFSNERIAGKGCDGHQLPEDTSNILSPATLPVVAGDAVSVIDSAIVNFGVFARLNAAPSQCAFDSGVDGGGAAVCTPLANSPNAASIANGHKQFTAVGCALCHTETLTSGPSAFGSLNSATYHPFSDFALHEMGQDLADGVVQGAAAGDEFRTAPLWGVGQRIFFLHDGRSSDLTQAIVAHGSPGSEANAVIRNFNSLPDAQKQDILNFLRSL